LTTNADLRRSNATPRQKFTSVDKAAKPRTGKLLALLGSLNTDVQSTAAQALAAIGRGGRADESATWDCWRIELEKPASVIANVSHRFAYDDTDFAATGAGLTHISISANPLAQ
jgi:hypothetical protein